MNENKKSKRILKILPWYMGLSYGLLFYTPISTLFFTIAKNLSPSQITLLGTISTLLCILLQPLLLKIIKKINNVLSVRIGSILLLLSVLLITFGNFYMIMIGIILETIAFTFKDMINIILRNNLIYAFKNDEYIKYKNKSFLIYSIATAIIALVVGYLFNLNYYIPMICCMICCAIIIIMSLFIDDIKTENVEEKSNNSYSKIIIKNKMIINIILFFGLIRTCIALGFNNSELFIQQELKYFFNIAKTTYYFSLIVFVSRIVRILSNLCLNKIYLKLREKLLILLPNLLMISFGFLVFSHYLIDNLLIKFLTMCLSYSIIVALIDFFTSVIQDTVLDKTSNNEQQAALTYLSLSYKVFKVIFGFFVSLILLRYSLVYVLIFLIVLILVGMIFFSKTYKKLIK
mgnify:CR=1 FL=1